MKTGTSRRTGRRASGRPRGLGISDLTAQRLSVYLRCLDGLMRAGIKTISSHRMSEALHLNSAQIRKDLACFGAFGVRGVGYLVSDLRQHLTRILGLTRDRRVAIIGAGNLGMALADYGGFNQEGFQVAALFDSDPQKIGRRTRRGVEVTDIERLKDVARRENLSIAVLAVPAPAAEKALELVVRAGIRAVLNFAPVPLAPPRGVTLRVVDLKIQLENLTFHLGRAEAGA